MGNAVQSLVKAQLDSGNFENCGFQGIPNVQWRNFKSCKFKNKLKSKYLTRCFALIRDQI